MHFPGEWQISRPDPVTHRRGASERLCPGAHLDPLHRTAHRGVTRAVRDRVGHIKTLVELDVHLGAEPETYPLADVNGAVVERELGGEGEFGDGSNFDLLGFERGGRGGD